jgi:hypothetical protein
MADSSLSFLEPVTPDPELELELQPIATMDMPSHDSLFVLFIDPPCPRIVTRAPEPGHGIAPR